MYSKIKLVARRFDGIPSADLTPSDQSPVFLHSSTEGDFLPDLSTDWIGERDFAQIGLRRHHSAAGTQRANIHEKDLTL